MMLKKFLQTAIRIESEKKLSHQTSNSSVIDLNSPDKEVDGFLIVGSTLSERKTIKSDCALFKQDCPPTYNSLFKQETMGNTPNTGNKTQANRQDFEDDCAIIDITSSSTGVDIVSSNGVAHTPNQTAGAVSADTTTQISNNTDMTGFSVQTVYSDVPFTLSPSLAAGLSISKMQAEVDRILNMEPKYDLQNFKYEFTLEKSIIRSPDGI